VGFGALFGFGVGIMDGEMRFILNEEEVCIALSRGTVLLDFIRNHKRLTGTKVGCAQGECGTCTVLSGSLEEHGIRYRAVASCLTPLGNVEGKHVVTIEGLNRETLTPVQQALVDESASQCGFCTPGFVVSLTGYCMDAQTPAVESALQAIDGNLCRCTGYKSIGRAVAKIVESLSLLKPGDRIFQLVEAGYLPDYFLSIPTRLKAVQEKTGRASLIEKTARLFVGGGTDLFVQRPEEMADTSMTLLLDRRTLKGMQMENGFCVIGGSVTMEEFRNAALLNTLFPQLKTLMKRISSTPIRNMATLSGNLVNASPIGDLTIFFLALESEIVLSADGKKRTLRLKDFYRGYKKLDLKPGEALEFVRFKAPGPNTRFNFEKTSKRTHHDIASVNSAMALEMDGKRIVKAGVSAGGVAPIPLFLKDTSHFLTGEKVNTETIRGAGETALSEISPIDDIRGSGAYKRLLLRQLVYAHFLTLFPDDRRLEPLI
jgi:xanthine dehydrogenase small subunit